MHSTLSINDESINVDYWPVEFAIIASSNARVLKFCVALISQAKNVPQILTIND